MKQIQNSREPRRWLLSAVVKVDFHHGLCTMRIQSAYGYAILITARPLMAGVSQ